MTNNTLTHGPSTAAPAAPSHAVFQTPVPRGLTTNSVLLEEAYDAYCRLQEKGIAFDRSAFVRGYTPIQSSLGRLIELHHLAEEESEREVAQIDWSKIGAWLRGNYDIECDLGEGKFSRVFLATQPKLGHRRVALKVTWEGDGEAYTLGRIDHPNVISAHGVETLAEQGLSVICMPYEGSSTLCSLLDRVMASHVPPPSAAVIHEAARDVHARKSTPLPESATRQSFEQGVRRLFARICDALEALHAQDILHRDLKPSNVLFRPDGSPVLLDFNLARDAKAPKGRFGGTYPYMPPEQLRAMAGVTDALTQKLDARSDIYSVGALLWETLTGKKPFGDVLHTQTAAECIRELSVRQQAGFTAPMPPNWTVSPELTNIVRRCLAVNPNERPRSAAELRNLLMPPAKRRRPALVVGVIAATLLLAVGGVWAATRGAPSVPRIPPGASHRQAAAARLYHEGLLADRAGDLLVAENAFSRVIDEDPSDARGYRARAFLTARMPLPTARQVARSLSDLKNAQAIDPVIQDQSLLGLLGYFHLAMDDMGAAARSYDTYRQKHPMSPGHSNNLAVIHTFTNRHGEAIAALDEVIASLPRAQAPRINRGMARHALSLAASKDRNDKERADLREKAIADLTEALRLGPDSGELRFHLAKVLAFPTPRKDWNVHLAKALEMGMDPKILTYHTAWSQVRELPEFTALLTQPRGDQTNWRMARLIPPRPTLPEWDFQTPTAKERAGENPANERPVPSSVP